MTCTGLCAVCNEPCNRTVNYEFVDSIRNTKDEITPDIEEKASEAFDLAVIEPVEYRVVKQAGKNRLRRIK